MTQEKKAKAYDEAKARMSRAFNSNRCTIGFMNEIFPELCESKDERIRKELIEFVKSRGGFKQEYIAWLENQGEQKPVNNIEPKFKVGDSIKTTNEEPLTITKIDDKGYWSKDLFICSFDEECIWDLVEQNPAWNEKAINKPNGGIVMEDFNDGNGFYKVNLAYLNEEQVEEIEELVKRWDLQPKKDKDESIISDLLDYFDEDKCLKHEVNDIVKWLKTIKPQQKGWGENEIKMLDNLITYLDGRKDLLEEIKCTYISWLKSLKQRIGG